MLRGFAVVPRPNSSRGIAITSSNGLAALARLRAAGFRVVAGTAENLASSYPRSICRVCSLRSAGRCADWLDGLVYSGRYGPSPDLCILS